MTRWSKPAHQFAASRREQLPENFKPGIDLSLGQLIETRHTPVISWLAPDSRVKTNRVGGFRSRFKGRGMDFDEVRLYQIGDDIRNIDWRVTARTGEAHTKLFKEERERPVFVVLDQMPSQFFGTAQVFKSVVAAKIASQLMWNTLSNGDRFGALLFSQFNHIEMKPSGNRRHCMRLLNRIVENHQRVLAETFSAEAPGVPNKTEPSTTNKPHSPLSETLKRLKFLAKPGSLIHLISDFAQFDESSRRQLSRLSQHTDIHCILISDPIEQDLPPPGRYGITNGVEQGLLNTRSSTLRETYRQAFQSKLDSVKEFALSHKGIFTQVDTNLKQTSFGHSIDKKNSGKNSAGDINGGNNKVAL